MRTALAELEEGELIEKALAGQAECWAESSFRTWITRVAINEAVMLCRRERAKPPFLMLPDGNVLACSGEGVDRSLIRKEVARAVGRAMVGLPSNYRQALILRDLNQLSAGNGGAAARQCSSHKDADLPESLRAA